MTPKLSTQVLISQHNMIAHQVPYYRFKAKKILTGQNKTIYWDLSIITDHTVVNNKPELVLIDQSTKCGYVINIAVPTDDNIDIRVAGKIRKNQEFVLGAQQLYRLDHTQAYPVVISNNGLIPNDTIYSVKKLKLPGKVLGQKAVLPSTLGTSS